VDIYNKALVTDMGVNCGLEFSGLKDAWYGWVTVAYNYNPSYLGGWNWEDQGW
jgi:hypothetical protein